MKHLRCVSLQHQPVHCLTLPLRCYVLSRIVLALLPTAVTDAGAGADKSVTPNQSHSAVQQLNGLLRYFEMAWLLTVARYQLWLLADAVDSLHHRAICPCTTPSCQAGGGSNKQHCVSGY